MIQTPTDISPNNRSLGYLSRWQLVIDNELNYETQIAKAKNTWGKSNKTMDDVKEKLRLMSNSTYRCNYCEDSYSDEIEHIYPKDIYPEKTFVWENYIYSCGPCNGPKSNLFSLIEPATHNLRNITPPRPKPIGYVYSRPPSYQAALIDPRVEDPMQYMMLDIVNTFYYIPAIGIGNVEEIRANYTIDLLRLNIRESLVAGRKQAFGNFKARLIEYEYAKNNDRPEVELNQMISNIRDSNHFTVWHEMKRWHQNITELRDIFNRIPEALTW